MACCFAIMHKLQLEASAKECVRDNRIKANKRSKSHECSCLSRLSCREQERLLRAPATFVALVHLSPSRDSTHLLFKLVRLSLTSSTGSLGCTFLLDVQDPAMAFLVLAFIAFLSTLSLIHASTQLVPCTGNDDQLKFYHDYTEPQCPGRFHLKGKDCEETDPINPLHYDPTQINLNAPEIKNCAFCDSYCQIKTSYTYGTEQPVDTQPLCRGPVHCEISGNEIVSYSWHEKPVGPDGWKAHVVDIAVCRAPLRALRLIIRSSVMATSRPLVGTHREAPSDEG